MDNDLDKRREELMQKAHDLAMEFHDFYSEVQDRESISPDCFTEAPYMVILVDNISDKVDFLKFGRDRLRTGMRTESTYYSSNDPHYNNLQTIFIEGSSHAGLSLGKV